MDILFKHTLGLFDVVSHSEINVGDIFEHGIDSNKIPQKYTVDQIIEQRKEKGTYADESKRRMWAKINVSKISQS